MSEVKRIKSWSYSTLKQYKSCPRKIKFDKIDGIKEPASPQMTRGTEIHALAENYVKEKQDRLPGELDRFRNEFAKLCRLDACTEEEWAFRKDWSLCGWFDADVWVRMKVDAYYREGDKLTIIDYKTGKVREENKGQCSFYAMGALLMFPDVQDVHVELWYLDSGVIQEDDYEREELGDMRLWWEHESRAMMADTIFAPRPSFLCKWCYYSSAKTGLCEF